MAKTITIPAAVDLHVHFRQPGDNKAETIKSGSQAAALGGFGLVCDMPNNPGSPTWTLDRLGEKQAIIKKDSFIPMAAYAGSQPDSKNLGELEGMSKTAIGLKLYGAATTGNHIDYEPDDFEAIVKKWHKVAPDKPIMLHSGKQNLDGFIDLIAVKNQHQLHVCHIFSVDHARQVTRAKQKKLPVSSAVCPHHLFKTSHHTITEGWFTRMQPPPLHQADAEELFELFARGQIDVLETDHAPHLIANKWAAEKANPQGTHDKDHLTCFGVPGIEFALPLLFYQMQRGRIGLDRIIEATSTRPAQIIGVKLSPKTTATWDLQTYRIGDEYPKGLSGSGWTPYLNNLAVGKVLGLKVGAKTIISGGKLVGKLPLIASRGRSL